MAQLMDSQSTILQAIRRHQPHLVRRSNYVGLTNEAAVVQAVSEDRMAAKFIIVTRQASPNLHNNKVQITPNKQGRGLVLDVHKGAPNVLFEHGESFLGNIPVGVSETKKGVHSIKRNSKQATAEVQFSQVLPDAALIFALVAEGTMRMASIGFIPMLASAFNVKQSTDGDDEGDGNGIEQIWPPPVGLDFHESLLLEWSIVSTGADTGAFKQALSRGHIHGEKLTPQFAMVCQSIGGPKEIQGVGWSPVQQAANHLIETGSMEFPVPPVDGEEYEELDADDLIEKQSGGFEETMQRARDGFELGKKGMEKFVASSTINELLENKFDDDLEAAKKSVKQFVTSKKQGTLTIKDALDVGTVTIANNLFGETKLVTHKYNQHFDPTLEHVAPAALEYDWVSRYLSCEVKELHNLTTHAPRLYMGSFLTGLKYAIKDYHETDVRNINGRAEHARECPPKYENVQLNSKTSDDFLTDGLQFLRHKELHKDRVVIKLQNFWSMCVEIYTPHDKQELAERIINDAWKWVEENNFLKGEAFSLSGKFLERGSTGFDDVFLAKENKDPVVKTVQKLNEKGAAMRNRGIIMMGNPGTGKTLSGRIMMNQAKATFVWISARDLFAFGAAGGLEFGFDLCRDLAPAIMFVEDIDNFLHDRAIDLIKTEMDGISRSSGIATILTTNYPERLPQALIDRPGRFDEILHFDLPDDVIRLQMLHRWLGGRIDQDVDGKTITKVVKKTSGYSGAHLRELCYLAVDDADENNESVAKCLLSALDKLESQRELIDAVQLEGGSYRGQCVDAIVETQAEELPIDLTRVGEFIAGGVDSQKSILSEQDISRAANLVGDAFDIKKEEVTDALVLDVDGKMSRRLGVVG